MTLRNSPTICSKKKKKRGRKQKSKDEEIRGAMEAVTPSHPSLWITGPLCHQRIGTVAGIGASERRGTSAGRKTSRRDQGENFL